MRQSGAETAEGAGAADSSIPTWERAVRRKCAADKVAHFPLIEHALELFAHGGPDMRGEAEALAALLADFAERMRRP